MSNARKLLVVAYCFTGLHISTHFFSFQMNSKDRTKFLDYEAELASDFLKESLIQKNQPESVSQSQNQASLISS